MTKRASFYTICLLFFLILGGWFAHEKYWEYRVIERTMALGYELKNEELEYWVKNIRSYNAVDRFDADIEKFIMQDKISLPPTGEFLFIGSSSIRRWKSLEEDMKPLKVINRGFGGAHTKHINRHIDKIVFPYEPKAIIFFCGSNDINGLNLPEDVFAEFEIFYDSLKKRLPKTVVFALSIQPSPSRFDQRTRQVKWNDAVSNLAKTDPNLVYVDVSSPMLSLDKKLRLELYTDDTLHMNAEGYKIWTKLVREKLKTYFPEDFL
jgi:lysophospholipase L1-like esterase